ncbi:hypothetical protein TNCV_2847321 [Trichonephila clavipes]|nr:hypothetical protein TNCV_2847321 [Trichonephila clavipes]
MQPSRFSRRSHGSAWFTAILADMHGDEDLKKAVQDYTRKHERDVYSSDQWKVFVKNNSTLAVEFMLLKWNK